MTCTRPSSSCLLSSRQEEVIDDFAKWSPQLNDEWQWSAHEARIKVALNTLLIKPSGNYASLEATVAPINARSLRTTVAIDKGQLTLMPVTVAIATKPLGADLSSGCVVLPDLYDSPSGTRFQVELLQPGGTRLPKSQPSTGIGSLKTTSSMVVPFWFVTGVATNQ